MITLNLPTTLEKHFREVVQESYGGNLQEAITAFLKLHEKYGLKEQLLKDVNSIRSEVRQRGGIKQKTIDEAVNRYRKNLNESEG